MVHPTTNMEIVALTTAMADARAAIQAAAREIQECRRQALTRSVDIQGQSYDEITAARDACNDILAVIQVHLSYLVQNNSLIAIPGTNAENCGMICCNFLVRLITELRVADYWAVATFFEAILNNINNTPNDVQYEELTQMINNNSESLQRKYTTTLAAFGVEVLSPSSYLTLGLVVVCLGHSLISSRSRKITGRGSKFP